LNAILFLDASIGYTVGNKGRILKTINGGGVGITENTVEKQINVYPNPASDIVTLNIEDRNNEDLIINIYNVIGTLVKTETLKYNNIQVNIGDLSNGVYLLTVKSKNLTANQRLIIQR
jgi:hypothetical protein